MKKYLFFLVSVINHCHSKLCIYIFTAETLNICPYRSHPLRLINSDEYSINNVLAGFLREKRYFLDYVSLNTDGS
jgi:hypothetical protein